MAPKVKGKVHWTQKRGNRARVLAIMRKAARARKRMAKAHAGKPRMARVSTTRSLVPAVTRREVSIPTDSILAPLVRKGSEGVCVSCRKPIREHYGHRGVWVGCRAPEVPATATFLLVPVILPADRPMVTGERAGRSVRGGRQPHAIAAETQTVAQTTRTNTVPRVARREPITRLLPRYVYAARDKRRNLVGASEAVADAYRGLLRASSPVNAIQAAKLAKRPTEANRRCLNLLVEQGLAVKTAIEP